MARPPNPEKLTDREVKAILFETWPAKLTLWNVPNEDTRWIRAQPLDGGPRLISPGARLFHIQPDGMWARLFADTVEPFADVVAVEACGSVQNLNDKRARYGSSTASLMLRCDRNWLLDGADRNPNWKVAGCTDEPTQEISFAVRHIRVLYALPGEIYENWRDNGVLSGHEFMCLHSSLRSYTSQVMQTFLRAMAPSTHYFIQT